MTDTFKKGVHLQEFKELSEHLAIEDAPLPERVIIPIRQHIGAPLQPTVERGQEVKTGQIIADSEAFVSAPVHASITGKVKKIGVYPSPLGPNETCVEITRGEEEQEAFEREKNDYLNMAPKEILERIRRAGIVGMGGAAFPTVVKFTPPKDASIDTVILNGSECEPFLTADHRVMLEDGEKMVTGLKIIMRALGAETGIIGIEENKLDAVEKLRPLIEEDPRITIRVTRTKYPQGAEKMLIDATTGRRIPPGSLPFHVGVIVSNVATAIAITNAVQHGIPLYQRVMTLTGDAISRPANLRVRVGAPLATLFEHLGGFTGPVGKIILGGPMMGVAQFDQQIGVTKATSGVLVLKPRKPLREYNCINCSECVYHCPMFLVPTRIARFARSEIWHRAEDYGALSCIECGSCSYICPSNIPLVQWIRVAKARIMEQKKSAG